MLAIRPIRQNWLTWHFEFQESDPIDGKRYWIQLNNVEDVGIASVKINGKNKGITWTKPFHLEITDALEQGKNTIEITVANS